MAVISRGNRFLAGALGGLALALLVVGAGALTPQASPQNGATSGVGAFGCYTCPIPSSSNTTHQTCTNTIACQVPTQSPPPTSINPTLQNTSSGVAALASPNSSASTSSSSSTPAAITNLPNSVVPSQPNAAQRPDSLLSAMPGEGVSTLLGTLSPLLVGLVIAGLVYGAYSRRQDS